MSERKFHYDTVIRSRSYWVPSDMTQALSLSDKETLIFEDTIEECAIAIPTHLYRDEHEIMHAPLTSLSYGYLISKIRGSEILLLHNKYSLANSSRIQTTYYIDPFFSPGFGGVDLHYMLFEKVHLNDVPNTIVIVEEPHYE